jgi:hypothetical protein
MDASEPHVRRRGFFLHTDATGDPDTGEHENPEGLIIRVARRRFRKTVRTTRSNITRQAPGALSRVLAPPKESRSRSNQRA